MRCRRHKKGIAVSLGCACVALLWASSGRTRVLAASSPSAPVPASAGAKSWRSELTAESEAPARPGSCQSAARGGARAFKAFASKWSESSAKNRLLPNFGREAIAAERRALDAFDKEARGRHDCVKQREHLLAVVRRACRLESASQRQILEQLVGEELVSTILKKMRHAGRPLRIKEKMECLEKSMFAYRKRVERLHVKGHIDIDEHREIAEVERRLGRLQFGVEDTVQGRAERLYLEKRRSEGLSKRRAHGISASLQPALRVMLRPAGLGNLQIFSSGPVGPPGSPAQVDIGIVNDRSMADVYREHPVPSKIAFQPAARVDVNLR